MGKVLLGLVAAGLVAVMVKGAVDGVGAKLGAVREAKPAAPAKPRERGEVVSVTDPGGCYRVMLPHEPNHLSADSQWLHGVGRGVSAGIPEPRTYLEVRADFIGSDEPNTPRQTLTWIVKKYLTRDQRPGDFDTVTFSRTADGVEVADYEHVWRGNGARANRTRHVLYRKWLYTLHASGLPDRTDEPEILALFDTFTLTNQALDHPDGGRLHP